MAKFVGTKAHTASATLPWLLAFAGFALLLAGVASMQQGCGKSGSTGIGVNQLQEMGAVGYLAPVT